MSDIPTTLRNRLTGLDEDVLAYLSDAVEGMSESQRRNITELSETLSPFLIDFGLADDEDAANEICSELAKDFGASGLKSLNTMTVTSHEDDEAPLLLSAPQRIADVVDFKKAAIQAFVDVTSLDANESVRALTNADLGIREVTAASSAMVDPLDSSAIPTTQREARRQRRANEALTRLLRAEAVARAKAEAEMAAARMAAIKASRATGRSSANGVKIEKFSIPHPSGSADLLTDASLTLAPGRRYGLVGKNGAGKSTLLRMLAYYKLPNLQHLRILLVDQHVEGDDDSALRWVLRADVEREVLLGEEVRLTEWLSGNASGPMPADLKGVNLEMALSEVCERLNVINSATAEERARRILHGLGFTDETLLVPTNCLSGGWAMRAALAAALYVRPHLLLLDEPTNHLDLHALAWLEHWLANYFKGMLLVVSHDEVFLDSICTDILQLRSTLAGQSDSSLQHFSGDYSQYQHTKKEARITQARARAAYEKEKEKLMEFVSREGKKYDGPAHQAQRKMRMKQLEKLEEVEALQEDADLTLVIPQPFCHFSTRETLLSTRDLAVGYNKETPLATDIELIVPYGGRIAIVGKNGCGKTSLLNSLIGEADPLSGSVTRHPGSRIAMLQQHHYRGEQLDPSLTALDHIRRLPQSDSTAVGLHDPGTRQEESSMRSYLASFGLNGSRSTIPVRHLSGGQRMRVAMAVSLFNRPDLLILDEPTNHLDAETLFALCEALLNFRGAILTVSHDEAYVNRVISNALVGDDGEIHNGTALPGELWVMDKGRFTRYDGSFADYKRDVTRAIARSSDLDELFSGLC